MNNEMPLAVRLYVEAQRFVAGLQQSSGEVKKFSSTARKELDALKGAFGSAQGRLAALGVTVGATATLMQSAKMDKTLIQLMQTAGASKAQIAGLRAELFALGKQTGQSVDDLLTGENALIQSGNSWKSSLEILKATNIAMGVTGAQAESLTSALTVANTAFHFDLEKPSQALTLLDQMTVAGRLGNAELENLSNIFGRIGPNAESAGLGFQQTLAFVEGLSMIERQPERLATLADSTLRLFTNTNYMRQVQKATQGRVHFFDTSGARRDALSVLADIKKEYDKFTTDAQRQGFIAKAFKGADLDTIKGMRVLFSGDMLGKINAFSTQIGGAGGVLKNDLNEALNNAVDQTGRLKATLREAADSFAKPIDNALSRLIKYSLDSKKEGGLGLSGGELIGGGILATLGLFAAGRYGGKAVRGLLGKAGGLAAGVATGKALEKSVGVVPVYVVNMPSSSPSALGADSGGGPLGDMVRSVLRRRRLPGIGHLPGTGGIALPGPAEGALIDGATGKVISGGGGVLGRLGALGRTGVGTLGAAGAEGVVTVGAGVLAAGAIGYGVGTAIDKGLQHFETGEKIRDAIGRTTARLMALIGSETAKKALELESKSKEAPKVRGLVDIRIDQLGRLKVHKVESSHRDFAVDVHAGYTQGAL